MAAKKLLVDCCIAAGVLATAWHIFGAGLRARPADREKHLLTPVVDVGVQLPIARLWVSGAKRTVVLMLDVRCQPCLRSRPFYSEVSRVVAGLAPDVRFVVLTEDPEAVAGKWLDDGGVIGADIVTIRTRKTLGFLGTPTLLLTDSKGVVTDIAFGALDRSGGERFKSRVRDEQGAEPLRMSYSIAEVSAKQHPEIDSIVGRQLIDARDRLEFAKAHSPSALNIPRDELTTRGPAELSRSLPVYIDCRYDDQGECRVTGSLLGDAGFVKVVVVLR